MPRGVEFRIPLADVFAAHRDHQAGWSLRALCKMRWEQWGYASPKSALEGLRHAMHTLDLPVRDRIEATVLASEVHGHASRAASRVGHPDHAEFLAHRRRIHHGR